MHYPNCITDAADIRLGTHHPAQQGSPPAKKGYDQGERCLALPSFTRQKIHGRNQRIPTEHFLH
ncbi:hypothetical protein RMSM_03837 [Rhodopirellula maiorica SM1]|uniref:Uncharacterized protein n=1 Tax=Rhodopirellula maiorica SM1 TaxID=1265738 RepID=M5RIU9_9BACT|nr:hypothetical protein RMSM_03837 [Rhodopirellula maiorica SM1]